MSNSKNLLPPEEVKVFVKIGGVSFIVDNCKYTPFNKDKGTYLLATELYWELVNDLHGLDGVSRDKLFKNCLNVVGAGRFK